MSTERSVEEIAGNIVRQCDEDLANNCLPAGQSYSGVLISRIAAALRAERERTERDADAEWIRRLDTQGLVETPLHDVRGRNFFKAPPGHILDDQGVVRKVLGALPLTADGCIPTGGSVLYLPNGQPYTVWGLRGNGPVHHLWTGKPHDPDPSIGGVVVGMCYSTRAAAEAAAKEVQGE